MKLPKELTTVTPLSKAVALIMFLSLPVIAFFFGMQYQAQLTEQNIPTPLTIIPTEEPIACTMDAKICPDGSSVGRTGPRCEFEACPPTQDTTGKKFTGTISSINYQCHMDGICSIGVGKASVIVDKGEGAPGESRVRGSFPQDLLDEGKKASFLGKEVEVYAASPDGRTDSYTLFGNSAYYIKLAGATPTETKIFCGGIAGKVCPANYYCKYEGSYPDAGGTCIKTGAVKPTAKNPKYSCPQEQYVNCMPGPGPAKVECSTDFLHWAQENCPDFQGAAY